MLLPRLPVRRLPSRSARPCGGPGAVTAPAEACRTEPPLALSRFIGWQRGIGELTRSKHVSKAGRNRDIARAKIAQMKAAEARRARRRNLIVGGAAAAVVIIVAVVIAVAATGGRTTTTAGSQPRLKLAALSSLGTLKAAPAPGATGPEGVPVPHGPALASTATAATGSAVDGIRCQTSEQTIFHIHAHLTIFVNGAPRQIPPAIGIPGARAQQTPQGPFIGSGGCFYWLHTHAADGIIHIESPVQRVYTLGQFFDEWGQPLGPSQVGPAAGKVTALYNGKVYLGNPRGIPLNAHAQIQLDVGSPLVAPERISFPSGL
jgi:hypothetical protein